MTPALFVMLLPMPWSVRTGPGQVPMAGARRVTVESTDPRVQRAAERLPRGQLTVRAGSNVQDESYRLVVEQGGAMLTASGPLGALHGLQTFRQLTEMGSSVPAITIEDHPRFAWRGLMLDVSRHFMPVELIERTLDRMAAVKLNVFHWHVSDDQGFRLESKRFPKLQGQGSDGQFYTQDDVRGIVAYAWERGIRVVPEFDMPGHATSWLVGYPELGVGAGPFSLIRTWGGYHGAFDPAKPGLYGFLEEFFGEMAALFPDPYVHIGGDEVPSLAGQIPGFARRVAEILAKQGRKAIVWDEVAGVPDVTIQAWHRGVAAASIQSYGYYLDLPDSAAKMYRTDPGGPNVMGGEACMWTEYASPEIVEGRIWPRAAAVAERLWSAATVTDVADLYRRLAAFEPPREARPEALQTLIDVLEPGGLGVRKRSGRNYTQATPLTNLVDMARVDSVVARRFNALRDRDEIRKWLRLWIANDAKLQPQGGEAALVSGVLAKMAREALAGRVVVPPAKPVAEVNIAVAEGIVRYSKLRDSKRR